MSKQIEMFMRTIIEDDPEIKKEYREKLEQIRRGNFIRISNFAQIYGLE